MIKGLKCVFFLNVWVKKQNKPYFIEHNLFTRKPHKEYLEHVVNLYANAAHNLRDCGIFLGAAHTAETLWQEILVVLKL